MRVFYFLIMNAFCLPASTQLPIWTDPNELFPGVAEPASINLGNDVTGPYFDVKTDANNDLHLVWSNLEMDGSTEIRYSLVKNGTVSSQNISLLTESQAAWPSLLAGQSGRLFCVWTEYNENDETAALYLNQKDNNENWGSPKLISDMDENPISIFPTLCELQDGSVIIAYNSVIFDEDLVEYLYELVFVHYQPDSGELILLESPQTDISHSAFRPEVVQDILGGFHCFWYDGDNGEVPSGRFVSFASYRNGIWSTPVSISDDSDQVWDDLPLQCLNSDGNLVVLWASFKPLIVNQMAIKPLNQVFQPSTTLPYATSNWSTAISPDGSLHIVGDTPQSKMVYGLHTPLNFIQGNSLIANPGTEGHFPEMVYTDNKLHLFWEEEGKLLYRSAALQTSSIKSLNSMSMQVLPNPCHDYFYLNSIPIEENFEIQILNSIGEIVHRSHSCPGGRIDVSRLPVGIYHVFGNLNGAQFTASFQKM